MRQVMENVESSQRQYGLRSRAIALGWREDQIKVIDQDQGESGASAVWREGFQHLVAEVGLGKAGIVMGLEVSRLARSSVDWQRLLEICSLSDTLILDEDGIYDPASFNDRLLLGLKGTMSEAELHVLKARLRGGVLNKVRRGEYQSVLPTGLVYDEMGMVRLDPDAQVRDTMTHFFETFARVGSICQTVKVFRREGVLFPSRQRGSGVTLFQPLTASTAHRVLNNPRYAGVYFYGRAHCRRAPDGQIKVQRKRNCADWLACIPNAHPGYIRWEQYEQNLQQLASNGPRYEQARLSPPREGAAVLQGRVVCGRCGQNMRVTYRSTRGKAEAWYVCDRAAGKLGAADCQTVAAPPVDEAIGTLVAEKMTPEAVELAIEVRREIETRQQEADQLRCLAVERAQTEADLAQRRFMLVDPANRLVADTLESEWNDKLRDLAEAREQREQARHKDQAFLEDTIHQRLIVMTTDFQRLWNDPATLNRERKRLLAYILEDATLVKVPAEGVTKVHLRFKGGKTETLTTLNPKAGGQLVKTSPQIIALIDKLLDTHTYPEIAELLNEQGFRPGGSARRDKSETCFTALKVRFIVHQYALRTRYDRLRDRGLVTAAEAATQLGVHQATLNTWAEHGIISRQACDRYHHLYEIPNSLPIKHSSRWDPVSARKQQASRENNQDL
jgi:DNA invertase Pin-like site-specific DNA recombinase